MPGQEWPWFSALHIWQKLLIGLVFGAVLLVLLLLPNRLGFYIMVAAAVGGFVGLSVGFRLGARNLERPETLARFGWLTALASIVSTIAIGLIALTLRRSLLLWLWTGSEALAIIAWMLFLARRSVPRVDVPGP